MDILEERYRGSQGVEKEFKHSRVLFIPPEGYSAPIITIMEGFEELGFKVYTIGKANINSWWFNKIIDAPGSRQFDFVLSGLLEGVRWGFYDKYRLHGCLKVLVDCIDNKGKMTWQDKHAFYSRRYKANARPTEPILSGDLHPHRWMEPLGNYKPDIVFTSQKNPGDEETFYLPFGIHRRFLSLYEGKIGDERKLDFTNIPGNGAKGKHKGTRERLTRFIAQGTVPGKVHNNHVTGKPIIPQRIRHLVKRDRKVHDYRRWIAHRDYFQALNDTKVFIYPNVSRRAHHWDSDRIWEALASGCLCLLEKPNIDMAQYPVTELCPEAQFSDYSALADKANELHGNRKRSERLRMEVHKGALRYFTPIPLARYFLRRILDKRGGD